MSMISALWNRLWIREDEDRPGEKGAIMVMGIFLACSMIAAMWYMMGIGDAIIWRDRQQEAADSIAFTSAAIHARGMNFIAMINILMLLIVAVYLIACIIRTILDLILYVSGDDTDPYCVPFYPAAVKYTEGHGVIGALGTITGFFTSPTNAPRYGDCKCNDKTCGDGVFYAFKLAGKVSERIVDNSAGRDLAIALGCAPCWACLVCFIPKCIASHPMHDIADRVGPIYEKVEWFITKWEKNIMRPVMPKMHTVEVATSVLTPWLGAAFSAYAGAQYKDGPNQDPNNKIMHKGIAFSPSMFRKLKKPQKIKKLRDDLKWIKCATQTDCGNGCGPTLCNNGQVSRSGPKKNGTSGTTAECCGANESGCNNSGTCSKNGGINPDQSGLYEEVTIDDSKDYRIGLPVQAENNAELCQKAFSYLGDEVSSLVSGVSGMGGGASSDGSAANTKGKTSGGGGKSYSASSLIQNVFDSAGGWFKKAYCTYDPAFGAAHSLDSGNYDDIFPGLNGSWDGNCSTQVCAGTKCPDNSNDFWAINDDDECPFKGEFGHSIPILFDGKHLGGNGPMKVVPYAPNGGDYNQVYSIVINDNYNPVKGEYGTGVDQTSWSKIRLAVGPAKWGSADESMFSLVDGDNTIGAAIVGGNGNGPWFYLAEAEFYHDCEDAWDDNACNGGDHATYRLNWRTRLRRVHKPIYIQELTQKIPGSLVTVAQKATANQWAINQITTTYLGIDLGTVFNYLELLAELGSNDPNGLMKPIYH